MGELQAHIRISSDVNIKHALLPGDPKRIDAIARHLTDVACLADNREYRSIRGSYKGIPILALSTGIGGPSTAIAIEELCKCGVRYAIRIGSCGALQPDIGIGELIIASAAVRDDGVSRTYIGESFPAAADTDLLFLCKNAAEQNGFAYQTGIVRSHDSFYTDREEEICAYWSERGVLGADMETAALFVIGRLRGLKTASILNNVVTFGGDAAEGVDSYVSGENLAAEGERREIITALEAFRQTEV